MTRFGYQFTHTTPRGKPLKTKIHALLLYLSGISMNRIAFLLRVFAQSGRNWIRVFAKEHEKKPEPTGRTIVLELDEMCHYLKEKRCKLWIWKALDQETGQLLDWECGRPDKVTLKKMVNRLAQWDVKLYCTDKWSTYFFSPQPLRPSASSVSALNSPARRHLAGAGSGQDGRAPRLSAGWLFRVSPVNQWLIGQGTPCGRHVTRRYG